MIAAFNVYDIGERSTAERHSAWHIISSTTSVDGLCPINVGPLLKRPKFILGLHL